MKGSVRGRAAELLALDPPTHLSPGEWRQLVEGLLDEFDIEWRKPMVAVQLGQTVIYPKNKHRPMAAIVVALNTDNTVNLAVFSERGSLMPMLNVPVGDLIATGLNSAELVRGDEHAAEKGKVEEGSEQQHS